MSFQTTAHAVSADGSVIVGGSAEGAFIWDEPNGTQSLRDLLIDEGVDLTAWTLQAATGISADGRTIVGYGTNPLGQTEAWIATVPEPTALPLLAVVMSLARCRRRRGIRCGRRGS